MLNDVIVRLTGYNNNQFFSDSDDPSLNIFKSWQSVLPLISLKTMMIMTNNFKAVVYITRHQYIFAALDI